jgi:hypothetical protein
MSRKRKTTTSVDGRKGGRRKGGREWRRRGLLQQSQKARESGATRER